MAKGSMWRNLGRSQQPFLLSNEFFPIHPQIILFSLCSEALGLPKSQSVLLHSRQESMRRSPKPPPGPTGNS